MVKRVTDKLLLNRGYKSYIVYGKCVQDIFIRDDLVQSNLVDVLDLCLNKEGYKNNILYDSRKTIITLRQSNNINNRRGRISLRDCKKAQKPPLDNPVLVASNQSSDTQSEERNRFVAWPFCIDYFNAIMMKQTAKRAIVFGDFHNCDVDPEIKKNFSNWLNSSSNGSIIIFIMPSISFADNPARVGMSELDSLIEDVKGRSEILENCFKIEQPDSTEIRNYFLKRRIEANLEIDWDIFENVCSLFSKVLKSNGLMLNRLHSEKMFLNDRLRLDKESVHKIKGDNPEIMGKVGERIIGNLHQQDNIIDIEALKNDLSVIRCQKDSTDKIAIGLERWWRTRTQGKPFAVVLAGTSGTGKTFTAETLHRHLAGYGYDYHYVDLTKFTSDADLNRLIGSPTGYIGSDVRPELFEKLRVADGKLVICFDELDKAYDKIMERLMQLVGIGSWNWNNEHGDFRQCIMIFTTNAKMNKLVELKEKHGAQLMNDQIENVLRDVPIFASYILGRINNGFYIYNRLTKEAVADIAVKETNKYLRTYFNGRTLHEIAPEFLADVLIKSYGSNEGARIIEKSVNSLLIDNEKLFTGMDYAPDDCNQIELAVNDDRQYVFLPLQNTSDSIAHNKKEALKKYKRLVWEQRQFDVDGLKQAFSVVKCQQDSTDKIADKFSEWWQGSQGKPFSILLLGTSGTGKTFTAKILYSFLKNKGYDWFGIDLNRFQSEADMNKIFGSPPGFIGSETRPELFDKLRLANGRLVICFDELDKSYEKMMERLMQLLDEGEVSWNNERGDFRKCVLVFASNIKMDELAELKEQRQGKITTDDISRVLRDVKQLPPTILGRLKDKYVYNRLTEEAVVDIALQEIIKKFCENYIHANELNHDEPKLLDVSSSCLVKVLETSYGSHEGGRSIGKTIEELLAGCCSGLNNVEDVCRNILLAHIDNQDRYCFCAANEDIGNNIDERRRSALTEFREIRNRLEYIDPGLIEQTFEKLKCQDDNLERIKYSLISWFSTVNNSSKPLSFFLIGPSGTGKTETAKLMATLLQIKGYHYYDISCNDMQNSIDFYRIIGQPGDTREPEIVSKLKNNNGKMVVLFDEVEKAYPNFFDSIMTLLYEGKLAGGDFRKCIIVLTSNLSAEDLMIAKEAALKEGKKIDSKRVETILLENGEIKLKPEHLGRISSLLIYNHLSPEVIYDLAWDYLTQIAKRCNINEISCICPTIMTSLIKECENDITGARKIHEYIDNNLLGLITTYALQNPSVKKIVLTDEPVEGYTSREPRAEMALEIEYLSRDELREEVKHLYKIDQQKVNLVDRNELRQQLAAVQSQDDVINEIVQYLSIGLTDNDREKPMSMLFAGMTGTGKSYTAGIVAKYLTKFGYGYHYLTMTNFRTEHDATRFTGSAEGLVGSDTPPVMIQLYKQYGDKIVVLFDEFDKAHRSMQDVIMQLLETGIFQSNKQTVYFKKALIIIACNTADKALTDYKTRCLAQQIISTDRSFKDGIRGILMTEGKMNDTFIGRLERILVFNPLSFESLIDIIWNEFEKALHARDKNKKLMHLAPSFLAKQVLKLSGTRYGARDIRGETGTIVGELYYEFIDEIQFLGELSLVDTDGKLVPKIYEGEPAKVECVNEAKNILQSLREVMETPQPQPVKISKVSYAELIQKNTTSNSEKNIEDIAKDTVGLVRTDSGSGSGFLISSDGYFLTCYHVIENSNRIRVSFESAIHTEIEAQVVSSDREADISLLKLIGENFPAAEVERYNENPDRRNQEVIITGFPMPDELGISTVNFAKGNVSNMEKRETAKADIMKYLLNCNAYPGDSGGPVFSLTDKKVIGVLQGGYDEMARGVNLAISIQTFFKRMCVLPAEENNDSNNQISIKQQSIEKYQT